MKSLQGLPVTSHTPDPTVAPRPATALAHPRLPGSRPPVRRAELGRGLAGRRPAAAAAFVAAVALAALVVANPVQVAVLLAVIVALLTASGRLRAALPYVRVALAVGLFLALLNPLFSSGGLDVLWEREIGPLTVTVTLQGIVYGVTTAMRLTALVLAFALLTATLTPDDQLVLFSRFSFHSGLVLSLAARMLPLLGSDAARIADAQRSRGVELDRGTRRQRMTARMPLLSALLTRSLERAVDVAAAMEARGYGVGARSRWMRRRPWRLVDVALVAGALIAAAALVAGLASGATSYSFFPLLDDPWPSLLDPWWLALLAALLVPAAFATLIPPTRAS